MKTSHYFYELPENYTLVKVIDAKNKKTSVIFILANLALTALAFLPCALIFFNKYQADEVFSDPALFFGFFFILGYVLYIVLHELTHGLFFKIFTHEKLKFGLTLTVAYCGVPDLYVKRMAALITTLAPFVIYNIVFIVPIFFITSPAIIFLLMIMFALHFGGCVGDLYAAYYLIFKNHGKAVIVNDTGPKQTFYASVE